jgi:hypothetical protein
MKQIKLLLLIIACVNIFAACKKDKTTTLIEPVSMGDQLPAITQSGAKTFGCIINGKVYIPKGYNSNGSPNPKSIYSIGLNGRPVLQINADQFINNTNVSYFTLKIGNLDHLGYYSSVDEFNFLMGWLETIGNCSTTVLDTTVKKWGGVNITKIDLSNQIVSGQFNCKYKTLACDTVFITDGRFDIKF